MVILYVYIHSYIIKKTINKKNYKLCKNINKKVI